MSTKDEEQLIAFLHSTCEIEIFESFAPTKEGLLVHGFNEMFSGHWHYTIWNKSFQWNPEYGTVGTKAHDPECIGWYYFSNAAQAPVLEVTRSQPDLSAPGRLYWANNFSAPNGLSYDPEEFSRWIDKIWRWVRKTGYKISEMPLQPYALPHAAAQIA
ncbi:hypothetical protein [Rhodoferax saidenbachensis]|nr:hypothetical protein [Rhodoferax saidenbachensis]